MCFVGHFRRFFYSHEGIFILFAALRNFFVLFRWKIHNATKYPSTTSTCSLWIRSSHIRISSLPCPAPTARGFVACWVGAYSDNNNCNNSLFQRFLFFTLFRCSLTSFLLLLLILPLPLCCGSVRCVRCSSFHYQPPPLCGKKTKSLHFFYFCTFCVAFPKQIKQTVHIFCALYVEQ